MIRSTIITELYRIRWQIELLFKALKSSLSIDKMNVGHEEYIEAYIYGRLIGTLLTLPLYDTLDTTMLIQKGKGVSMQRFYKLLADEVHRFYILPQFRIHNVIELSECLFNIGNLALHEKRKRKTTFEQIEYYLSETFKNGKD